MLFRDFLSVTQSVREYDNREVEIDRLDALMDYAALIEKSLEDQQIKFVLFNNGDEIYSVLSGLGGYGGVMIKSPHYIGITIKNDNYKAEVMAGYAGEAVIKKAFELGLGTCWINLNSIPEKLEDALAGSPQTEMNYMIALGYPDKDFEESKENTLLYVPTRKTGASNNPHDGIIVEEGSTKGGRLSVLDIVYLDEWGKNISFDELAGRGLDELFFYVRSAPSNKNNQPWRFILEGGEAALGIIDSDQLENYTDAGIIMYLFEGMANELSIPGKWQFMEPEVRYQNGEKYSVVGRINL